MHPDDASGQLATPCVDGIYRYPVKGLTGQRIPRVDLRPGTGIPHDRRFAISNGHSRPPGDGAWTARAAFFHLAKNADLTQIGVTFDGHELAVQHPQLGQLSISVDQPESITQASAALATWFKDGAHGSARLVQARRGYWDGEQATLSLINLDTVTDLAAQAGHDLDPLRFRANIYLSGLAAWEEFNLVNRRIRIGDAELEILRPIDRCRATSVNPATGEVDVNLPALLGSRYGHIYCGLYARVVKAGSLAPGQQLRDLGRARSSQTDVVSSSTTETTQLPPRLADVLELVTEDRTVTSFWIRDPLRSKDAGGAAGKHIRVHAVDQAGPLWRSYSISAVQDDAIRISVKNHAQGRMSGLLHETTHRGDQLLISGPFGGAPFAAVLGQPVLLASAGVGITSILPILASLNRAGFASPLLLCHTARNATGLALWAEARKLVKSLPNAHVRLYLTRPRDGECERYGARPGRPQVAEVARQLLALDDTVGYICGPPSFVRHSQTSLELAGLPMHRLHHEVFHSPRPTAGVRIAPPKPGPFHVHFTASDVQAEWRPEAGTLLELGEQAGIGLPAGCREGACHTCRQQITAGATANLTEPMLDPPDGSVLLCCAVPTTDVTINA